VRECVECSGGSGGGGVTGVRVCVCVCVCVRARVSVKCSPSDSQSQPTCLGNIDCATAGHVAEFRGINLRTCQREHSQLSHSSNRITLPQRLASIQTNQRHVG